MSIRINISKAKDIKLDQFRLERQPRLEALDLAYIRALESGDIEEQERIKSEKKALRDVTKIVLPDDINGLKNFKPDILK
jgi:hypothetical protein